MQNATETTKIRKTYSQNWRAYNAAQTSEKAQFQKLLHALCSTVEDFQQTNGRPRLPIKDALFAINYKIYSTISGRRFMTDLREAKEGGYIGKTPHFNSIFNYLENQELTPILQSLIVQSSLPLASIEVDFAADSSGFTACRYARWHDHKYGDQKQKDWVKVHLMCGVKTNIVTAVVIADKNANDCPMLPALLKTTVENFSPQEVSADKAYGSFRNYDAISTAGAVPYIPFKERQKKLDMKNFKGEFDLMPDTKPEKKIKNALWNKMYHYFQFQQEEYMQHYHKRSNVETTFSMIKAKFGSSVRSKTDTAMMNECLCKVICHNICVLIQEMHELGIDVDFSKITKSN